MKEEKFTYIPRDFSEVRRYIEDVNKKYGVEISIVKDVKKYIVLHEMREIAEKHGFKNALKQIDDLIKQNFAHDLTQHNFIMVSKRMHESIVKDRQGIADIIEEL